MRSFFILGSLAVSSLALASTELWVGKPGLSQARVKSVLAGLGEFSNSVDGFVVLRSDRPEAELRREIARRGIPFAFLPSDARVDPNSYESIGRHIRFGEARFALTGKKEGAGVETGVDFAEALKHYLSVRTDENGILNQDAHFQAIAQREKMPPAKPELFGKAPGDSVPGVWRVIGPTKLDVPYQIYYGQNNLSGRKNDVAYFRDNPNIIATASAGGGIWRSEDAGANWRPLSERWPTLHSNTVIFHPTDSNIMWAGMGDYVGFFNAQTGGVMKTTNGGLTWTNYGAADFGTKVVSKMVTAPENPDVVLATTGRGSGPAGDVWRSTDGGLTWARTNAPDGDYSDMEVSAVAGLGGNRRIWAMGPQVAYSDDQGATWSTIAFPAGFSGLADIAASKVDPDACYIVADSQKVFKRDSDAGGWTDITAGMPTGYNWSQAWYDIQIGTVKSGNTDIIYVGLITVTASRDGGATWVDAARSYENDSKWHNDQHCMAPHPTLDDVALFGGDGGVCRMDYTVGGGYAFTMLNDNLVDTQFYAMSIHPTDTTRTMGGSQDNATPASRGDLNDWKNLWAGDGFGSGFNGTDPGIHYTTSQGGGVYRYDTPDDMSPTSISTSTAFATPFAMGGAGRQTPYTSGGGRVRRHNGTSWVNSTTALTLSYVGTGLNETNIIGVNGSGQAWSSTDSGDTFVRVDGLIPNVPLGDIEENPFAPGEYWVTVQTTDGTAKVWTTAGVSYPGLPNMPANAIAFDPNNANNVFVGTDVGCFLLDKATGTWSNMNALGMPNVHVNDLRVSNDGKWLYAATFGRGIWRIPLQASLLRLRLARPRLYNLSRTDLEITADTVPNASERVLLSDNSLYATTPVSVGFNGVSAIARTVITTSLVPSTQSVTITATWRGSTRTTVLVIYPFPTMRMSFTPNPARGGTAVTGRIDFGYAVPLATTMQLTESSVHTSLPINPVNVPAGARFVTFPVATTTVPAVRRIEIRGTFPGNPAVVREVLTLNP